MKIRTLTLAASLLAAPAAACDAPPGGAAVAVSAHGLKDRSGNIRVAIYNALESEMLASGKYVTRLDVPVTTVGDVPVCATVPAPGDYVVTVLHDRNRNGKLDIFGDGVGFSNNPRLKLAKPPVERVKISLPAGSATRVAVTMNYLRGLSVGPIKPRP